MPTSKWMHPADERILRHLRDNPPEYAPLVATRLGLEAGYVERRVETLVEKGMLEAVSGEVVYKTTERGDRHLETADTAGVSGETTSSAGSSEPPAPRRRL
jgi:DNA-binding Lrp family transcriptional regulator